MNIASETRHDRGSGRLLQRALSNEEYLFLVLAIFIGVLSGLAVVCFRISIDASHEAFFGAAVRSSPLRLIFIPAGAGLGVAVLVFFFFPTVRGSGVNQTKAALYIYDGIIPFRTAVGKFICSSLAIGGGHSLGPEDPSLQIGATLASLLGQKLQLSRERLRLVAPIGAAAGLAAAFNAPISAVLFVIEEVVGRWTAGIFGATVLAAASSVVVARWFLGSEPLFRIPTVEFIRPSELLAYAFLGVVGAFASVVMSRAIAALRASLMRMPRWTFILQPAVAGLGIGLIAVAGAPQVMGAGYHAMDQAMHGEFTWQMLAILAGLKIVATTFSFTSGTPGGMFAPTLFIGAMLGGAVGGVERVLFPHLTGSPGTYALVGMGVLFAGFLRAPMTSVFMVFEVSGNYSIVLPVLVANTIAYLICRNLQKIPIFDLLSRQDGVDLPSMEEQREAVLLRIEDVMRQVDVPVIRSSETVASAIGSFSDSQAGMALVDDRPRGWTAISVAAVEHAMREGDGNRSLSELIQERVDALYPDSYLQSALHPLSISPLLPVIHRADPQRVLGVVSLHDLVERSRNIEPFVTRGSSAGC